MVDAKPTTGSWWQGYDNARTMLSMSNIRWTIYDDKDRVIAFVVASQGIDGLEAEANGDLIRRAPDLAKENAELKERITALEFEVKSCRDLIGEASRALMSSSEWEQYEMGRKLRPYTNAESD
jgi:hypothetical protein